MRKNIDKFDELWFSVSEVIIPTGWYIIIGIFFEGTLSSEGENLIPVPILVSLELVTFCTKTFSIKR